MMKKLFHKWGPAEDGKGKKASGRTGGSLVRGPDIPAHFKTGPLLLAAGENGTPEKEPPDMLAPRPVPSFITNSVNLPSYGQSAAVPLPLPSGAMALPLPEPNNPGLPPNPQGNPQSLPTEEKKSPGGFSSSNQRLAPEGDVSAHSEKGVSSKSGLTISHTGGSKSTYSSPRPQKGLSAMFRGKAEGGPRSNQNPLPFNFPNQRPSPLETVLNGQKRGQVGSPSASEPFASPQQLSEMSSPSPLLTSRSGPTSDWTSSVPPVSPLWNRSSQASGTTQLHLKLRRSPSLNSNTDTDNPITSSPLSRFSPVGQANHAANPGKTGKSAPSSPSASEGAGGLRPDGFGVGHSLVSALSEPPIGPDVSILHTLSDPSEMVGSIPSTPGEGHRSGGEFLGRHLLGLEPLEESVQDSTSEASSIGGVSESTESTTGTWVSGSSPYRGGFHPPRVHFDLNPPLSSTPGGGSNVPQISPRGKAHCELGDAPMQDPPRQKEVGEEDLTRSTTPRTAEALQRETGRQKGSQASSQAPLGTRSPQKPLGGAANRVQRPVNTHLNVPKQLTPITAGPAWHESIAGLPGSSSETPSSAPQAHPLPDIDQAYTPPSRGGTPSPKDGASLPPPPPSLAGRGASRGLSTRPLPSPENLHHHSRASSDGRIHTKSNDNMSPGSGKPIQLGGMAESASRPKPIRGQSEPISRGLLDAAYLPRPDAHHLPLSEATRTSSDPARLTQRRASLDQDATPLPLPLPPAEDRTSRAVSSSQSLISPAQPSPLPALPSTAYPLNQSVFSTGKSGPHGSTSPSPSTRSPSPHQSPISVLQRGDRAGRDSRGVNAESVAQGPKLPVNWRKGDKLGSGTFGSVYRGLNTDNGEMFAVKEVGEAQQNVLDESTSQLEHEVALLSRLKHPNIVQYVGTKREDNKLYIFLEYMPGGSIESNLRSYGRFTEPLIRSYTKQILCGLKYLHDQSTIHRDIKGANILVDINGRVKLADFGMAKEIREGHSQSKSGMKGSPFWMAPEVVKQERRADGRPADIWSVGCTVLEMAEGVPPWSRDCTNQIQIMWKIASSNDYPHIPAHLSETAVNFIKLCLNRSPDDRPKADDLLNHPFIADVIPETPPGLTAAMTPSLAVAFPRPSPPSTPSPRPMGLVIPRAANRTAHSPGSLGITPRLVRQTSGKLEELAEEEESVSATVAALVDTPSPRAGGGSKVVPVTGATSGKHQVGGPKSRPKTPPPNWSPTGASTEEPKLGVKVRVEEVSGRGLEETAKPRLRWKSPTSSFEAEGSAPNLDDPAIHRRSTLFRHKSADAPNRRPLGTLVEDKEAEVGRLHKGISMPVPLEAARREGPLDKVGATNASVVTNQRRHFPSEVG